MAEKLGLAVLGTVALGVVLGFCDTKPEPAIIQYVDEYGRDVPTDVALNYLAERARIEALASTPILPTVAQFDRTSVPTTNYAPTSYSTSDFGGTSNNSETYVRGYTTKTGRYVAPHYRTTANSSKGDNWSSRGNSNPRTGRKGNR